MGQDLFKKPPHLLQDVFSTLTLNLYTYKGLTNSAEAGQLIFIEEAKSEQPKEGTKEGCSRWASLYLCTLA